MSAPPDPRPAVPPTPQERLAALPPEDRDRIGTAMRFLLDLKAVYNEGLQVGTALLEGKVPAAEVGMRLVDLERALHVASEQITRRPLRVAHADALRRGQTRLGDEAWLTQVRIKAREARRDREEKARQDATRAPFTPEPQPVSAVPAGGDPADEPEQGSGPRL